MYTPPRKSFGLTSAVEPRPAGFDRGPRPEHDARQLTAGGTRGGDPLDGVRYMLRITRQGKLILTK